MQDKNKTTIQAVATALGFTLEPTESTWQQVYLMQDGGRLYASESRQRGKLSFHTAVAHDLSNHRPYWKDGEAPELTIGVSDSKPVAVILSDVQRRLLPEYRRAVAAHTAAKQKNDADNAAQRETATKLAKALGLRLEANTDGSMRPLHLSRSGVVYAHIQVNSDGTDVRWEHFSTNSDTALKVAKALAQALQ
jgi:hypothetical protein